MASEIKRAYHKIASVANTHVAQIQSSLPNPLTDRDIEVLANDCWSLCVAEDGIYYPMRKVVMEEAQETIALQSKDEAEFSRLLVEYSEDKLDRHIQDKIVTIISNHYRQIDLSDKRYVRISIKDNKVTYRGHSHIPPFTYDTQRASFD